MKKRFKVFFMAFALVCILCIQKQTVFAANIVTVSATGNSTSATVSGTAENGVTAVAIMVYDSTGTNLIIMESVSVRDDHTFNDTINLASGSYLIKVADYEGGTYSETTVTVAASNTPSGENGSGSEGDNPSSGNGSGNSGVNSSTNNSSGNSSANTTGSNNVSGGNESVKAVKSPKTGDTFFYEGCMIMLFVGIGLSACVICNQKKKAKCD
ncbi:hypothetical protein [Roseburia sp. 499]|uniref:hypothetical protein n=1 Tax=Roseburia sp. 499 TaxID=1261634 RepID=UPI0009520988|nr:hypothetical protein [Roseburia sp. 499]WVK68766.1 hypothetical protein BIV20_10280 [Roseburia sp. 499]